ncbi:unnamed protein product [Rotaria socialis]|uniref:Uncharacterized protein n=1 Tax=Rotaria socialis TaxID=392032 RepID=A0A818BW27_9BILA|nr:unnamed protein product [Rotaria socialis]
MVHWSEYFWGEGNRGLEIFSSNVKNGAIAIEEFQRFINESIQCESAYCKNLSRLQSQLHKAQYLGTFTPIWNLIRDLFDRVSSTRLATVNFYQELLRDIHNYQDIHQKKVKAHIQKDGDITRTLDLISHLNTALNIVNKAKEQYHSIASDYERAKRANSNVSNNSSAPATQENSSPSLAQSAMHSLALKQLERLEKKYRLAQDDYKSTIDKYNLIRIEYEKRFQDTCTKFQDFEINHIEKLLAFSLNYSEIFQRNNGQITIAQNEFNNKLKSLSGNDLLDIFVEQKKTGTDRPATLQLEELDNLKTSTNSNISDFTNSHEDSSLFDQLESGVPSFQAHFTVPLSGTKTVDNNNRARHHHHQIFHAFSPHSTVNQSHSPSHNPIISPTSNMTTTTVNTTISGNQMLRSQDSSNSSSDQVANPFDVKIRKPKFKGFFGTNRRDKNAKKDEKKPSSNTKPGTKSQAQQSGNDSNGVNLPTFNDETNDLNTKYDNDDGSIPTSHRTDKNKCATPEPYIPTNPSILRNELDCHGSHSLVTSRSSKLSSSSDSSDDDDSDNPVLKIEFKINPKSEAVPEIDDEMKIVNAMRLIDKNIGNLLTPSKGSPNKTADISKSSSSEQMSTRILPPPPPIPLRTTSTPNSVSVTTENIDQLSMFPPHDMFDRSAQNSMFTNSINQETIDFPPLSTIENNNATPITFIDDDTEVSDSFSDNNATNKVTELATSDVPPTDQSNQEHLAWAATSSPTTSTQTNLRNSPLTSNEQRTSPLQEDNLDQIPLAIAFQEVFHAMMSGNNQENWKKRIVGELLISFPASMLNIFVNPSQSSNSLQFRLKNSEHVENITTNSSLIIQNEPLKDSNELIYTFDMTELNNTLRNLQETKPSSLFFNLNALTYEVKNSEESNVPIQISSNWTRTLDTISVNINYSFNSSALPDSMRLHNDCVIFYTIITDGQEIKESLPTAEWSPNECKLWWKVPYTNDGTGNLSATLTTVQTNTVDTDSDQPQQQQPLTTSSIVNAHFIGENSLFSSIDFDLTGHGYRVSLLKKKILSGKYQSEPDQSDPTHLFQRPTIPPASIS